MSYIPLLPAQACPPGMDCCSRKLASDSLLNYRTTVELDLLADNIQKHKQESELAPTTRLQLVIVLLFLSSSPLHFNYYHVPRLRQPR